ncbi:MAG: winged helix-turn-helix transcriptional regulator [Armatimonadetes bacterium]|nr:winged helix-turn-helix transcriptional regulator [Armatimonadota bacterium]
MDTDKLREAAIRLEQLIPLSLRALFHGAEDPLGWLSVSQIRIFRSIEGGPVSASDLAEIHGLTLGAISQHMTRLQAAGLIDIEPDPNDRRVRILTVSAEGKALSERRAAARQAAAEKLLRVMPEDQLLALLDGLTFLAERAPAPMEPRRRHQA